MSDPNGSESASRGGRATVLWGGVLVPALAATAVLMLGDSARLLRLGLVAALWAALIAALAVVRLRNRVAEDDERAADQQRLYELELEREVAARREFELEAENEARRRVTEESDSDVESLRAELRHLRETLETLVGGDVLYERVALRAESTRVRQLADPDSSGYSESRGHSGMLQQPHPRMPHPQQPSSPQQPPQQPSSPQQLPPQSSHSHQPGGQPHPQVAHPRPEGSRRPGPVPVQNDPARDSSPAAAVQGHIVNPTPPHGSQPPQPEGTPEEPSQGPSEGGATRPSTPLPAQPTPGADREHPSFPGVTPLVPPENPSRQGEQRTDQQADVPAASRQAQESADSEEASRTTNGAHAEGTSVVDLLAAYGSGGDAGRRRRRSG
ncbi:DUF6779 domain-containing protein [Haloactinomyces albus]|uniref:DUF6779 domain-containing protein n=1 Tax=Haloactinomyces albus TaxID=1352928 RepID=A0AAE3ZDI5_9ACTN|nr:DUF6779 domain-containing protein [Haloactinomyces albus]MDR7301688.1 hypothetical protein [Haloactinomyces albus]